MRYLKSTEPSMVQQLNLQLAIISCENDTGISGRTISRPGKTEPYILLISPW
jgi:hypothetical protein